MKKKGTAGKIRLSSVAALFVVAAVISSALRSFQFFTKVIDPEDGALEWSNFTVVPLYAVVVIAAILLLVLPLLSANIPKSVFPQRQSAKLGFAGLILTLGLILDVAIQTGEIIVKKDTSSGSIAAFLKETGLLPNILQVFFGLFAALYALLFAISYFKGKNVFSSSKILALAPTGWVVCRLISRFTRETSFSKNTELFFELAMLCFLMLFFFAFARIASQLGNKGKMWAVFGCGFPAAMLSLLCSLPRLAVNLAGRGDLLVTDSRLEYADLAVFAFLILFLFTLISEYKSGNYENYNEENAFFDFTKKDDAILSPVADVIPDTFVKPAAPAKPAPGQDDEAFEIASQYSNQYMQSAASYSDEPAKDSAQEEDIADEDFSAGEDDE
ncbi:MAG: hypothetical protein LBS36_00425 [Oscillospiraceae bacterium]|nr:hypothetical protein [Oscillospiraceae bacterium]